MKKSVIVIIIIVLLILLLIGVVGFMILRQKKKDEPIQSIHHMYFHYSTSTAYLANVTYDVEIEDEKYYATIKLSGQKEEDAKKVELSEKDLKELMDILNKHHIGRWDEFKKSNKYVLDGNDFSFGLRTLDDREVYASGYESYPAGYKDVKEDLDHYFQSL